MNYDPALRNEVEQTFRAILEQIQGMVELFGDVDVTVCVGRPYETPEGFADSREEALRTLWTRRALGTRKVLYYNDRAAILSPTEQ